MSFADHMDADRRLTILKLLVEDGGSGNDRSLTTAFREMGDRRGLDQAAVRRLLRELAERECVTTSLFRDTVMSVQILERGRMAVAGDIRIDGIASPHMGL